MLCVTVAVAGAAGHVARVRLAPRLQGLEALLAAALLATLALVLEHLVPLALGVLSRGTVLVAAALLAAATTWVWLALPDHDEPPRVRQDRDDVVVGAVAAGAVVLTAGAAVAFLGSRGADALLSADALNFQVPQVVRWMQSGSMWQLDQFYPQYSNATYPQHGNVLFLAVVLPFDSALLVRWVSVPFAALTAAAVFAAAREVGASRAWAVLAGVLPAAMPLFARISLDSAQTDTPMTFAFGVALLFLLRHHRTQARSDLLVAGVAVGFAAATKWYAYSQLPPMIAIWAVASLCAGVTWRRVLRRAALLCIVAFVIASPWLVRNLVEAGNPLFPQAFGPFYGPPDPVRAAAGFALLDYVTDGHVWSAYLLPQFREFFAWPGFLMIGAPFVALVLAARRRAWVAFVLAVAALAGLIAYLATPFSAFGPQGAPLLAFANTRYGLPAILIGAVLVAWIGTHAGRAAPVIAAIGGLAVLEGVHEQYRPDLRWATLAGGIVAVATAVAVLPRLRRSVLVGGALAGVVLGAAALRTAYDTSAYAAADPVLAALADDARSGRDIALAGIWSPDGISPVLPAYGPRLANRVTYLGEFREHLLQEIDDPRRFARRLRGYDYLIVGRGITPDGRPAREEAWARSTGFEPVAASDRLALLAR